LVSPLKPYEAMAMGKAMVLSNVRALSDIAKESGSAVTFEAGNVDSLVAVLAELSANPKKRAQMGAKATKWVTSERTWDKVAATTLEVYKKLRK
jgi:glycosyltransferase involved in cell wall biosynthesis